MVESVLFYLFAGLMLVGVGAMIVTKNIIHGAYALVVVLLSVAALYVLLNAEYLAVVQIFMYAGGVIVLLIFGIMLTNRSRGDAPKTGHRQVWLSAIIAVGFCAMLVYVTMLEPLTWNVETATGDQTKTIGVLLITEHLLAFEMIALLPLAALVGAAFLAKKSSEQ